MALSHLAAVSSAGNAQREQLALLEPVATGVGTKHGGLSIIELDIGQILDVTTTTEWGSKSHSLR